MQVIRHEPWYVPGPFAVTIGAYDGVHLGHRAVIQMLADRARELSTPDEPVRTALVTFDRHPAEIIRPEAAPPLLTSLEHKLEILESIPELDVVVVLRFDKMRREEEANQFVWDVLVDGLSARCIVVGEDFHFGKNRAGDVALLETMGAELGFEVHALGLLGDDRAAPGSDDGSASFSSTRVRELIQRGDVGSAAEILGRLHELRGVVTHGDARGRDLGFPTANVDVDRRYCWPADGVYAGALVLDGEALGSAISLGTRESFDTDHSRLVEVHVLDWDGDLYDREVGVRFGEFLRPQRKFTSLDELTTQLNDDVARARRWADDNLADHSRGS
ncbi:MAG: bifunctional riboflavin kinase/FAD synthetase [Actinobacteria bacterium]|nr:bifunctional riboflavin kinase/FAD synthetase [Actinomycetota bacterium]